MSAFSFIAIYRALALHYLRVRSSCPVHPLLRFDLREVPFVEADEEINGNGALRLRVTAMTGGLPIWRQRWPCYTDSEKCREGEDAEAAGSGDG